MQGVTSNWSVHINTQINPNAICIVWTLFVMILAWVDIILDVEGAFFREDLLMVTRCPLMYYQMGWTNSTGGCNFSFECACIWNKEQNKLPIVSINLWSSR